ncbi:hypothetical protein GCM10010981_33170 [Dyella nitratireducens]|uniref:Uncharacterized protein n=1 Tax=Dyella nitratireducens TaxID=1849580 RepID=A0ABQ1GDG1_9GAMM|nr:hypothetical protein GCM10010981_33170 [Dyella nitratireducens]
MNLIRKMNIAAVTVVTQSFDADGLADSKREACKVHQIPLDRQIHALFPWARSDSIEHYAATCSMSPSSTLCVIDSAASAAKLVPLKLAMA